jgi:tRNA-Thr(GGU) m(6)t(6)A37 methyltransferase TsaA
MPAPEEEVPSSLAALQQRVAQLECALAASQTQRAAERAARIRLQRQLRSSAVSPDCALQARAVGTLHSCFSRRNGTPRQPSLVPAARAVLQLRRGVPRDSLFGLEAFSHCWVLYVFHQNTDAHRVQDDSRLKSRVCVPRLDGATRGVFATRTPHRPVALGLSLGRLVGVDLARGCVTLEGLDLVDGTPVLDLKPYVPFCDAPDAARERCFAPDWVAPLARGCPDAEPLRVASVALLPGAADALWRAYAEAEAARRAAWAAAFDGDAAPPALYDSQDAFTLLVTQVLSRDIRSLRQRTGAPEKRLPLYHVILCCVEVDYTVSDLRHVLVTDARRALPEEDWAAMQDAAAAEAQLSEEDA